MSRVTVTLISTGKVWTKSGHNESTTNEHDFIKLVSNKVMSKFCSRRGGFHPDSGDVSNRGQKMKSCMEVPRLKGI